MFILVTIIHIVVSLFLIVVVLLQSGKAADLSAAFGGAGSQTVFGPRGSATVLTRATTVSAILFMITSLSLAVLSTGNAASGTSSPSILDSISTKPGEAPKAAPAPNPAIPVNGTVPVQVTPSVGGTPGVPQTVNAPVLPEGTPVEAGKK